MVKHNFVYLINFKHYYFNINLTMYNNYKQILIMIIYLRGFLIKRLDDQDAQETRS